MPGKIGVLWSNQNTDRWGFKTHTDGASPSSWSADEVPASQSALDVGYGMADDHMNLKVASDGTLYCAIKTGYNDEAYPLIGLLVRRPNGVWDDLYDVSRIGTTPIVVLNEEAGKLRVVYPSKTYGGDILYNESPLSNISIGPQMTLMRGAPYRDPTSSKQNFSSSGVILTTDEDAGVAAGVLVNDDGSSPPPPSEQYTLSVSTVGSGSVSKSPTQNTYAAGSTVSLTATPAAGYQFAGWSGDVTGTTNPLSVVMNNNITLTATFTETPSAPEVVSFVLVDAVTEQDVQTLADGATVSLSSLANTKLNIRANTSPASVGSVRFELSGAQSKTYTDNGAPYALHGDNGNGNYYYGNWNPPATGTYTLRATPYAGSKATGTAGTPLSISFTIVDSDDSPSDQYSLTTNTTGSGTVAKSPNQETYAAGSTVSLTATPAAGYQFAGWSGDASSTANPLNLLMDGNKNITATFTAVSSGSLEVTSFVLVDSHTEQDVQTLADGATISLSSLANTKLNIRANTSPASVGSVRFELSGAQSKTYTDNGAPYALHGDNGNGNYYYGNWNPPATGTYTLRATPYEGSKATGTVGTPLSISFTIVDSDGAMPSEKNSKASPPGHVNHPKGIPPGLERLSAHPNPFSSKARVRFTALEDGDYTISLYDSKGGLIRVVQQGNAISGDLHELDFDGSDLGKGLYIIRLQTRNKNETFRLMLER
ncbi:T9SS type A sorting domain-containing protein [uncultured Pontibacter sp.]|uniref:InlB B-repeat-containing protein n=1 Tax=uncultured Pontibacter sp. TaxID=453356 RepID=UPI0026076E87|nr:T9SS type A sorting domain-containing protein [uncultured Pontibacter sp.]